jgi:hypothetical protein
MSSQGIMSSKKASNDPGLCPVKGQKPSLSTQTGSRNKFSSLSLGITKTSPPYPMLVNSLGLCPTKGQNWINYKRDAHIVDARKVRWLHCASLHLIFVGPQGRTCITSPYQVPRILRQFLDSCKLCEPLDYKKTDHSVPTMKHENKMKHPKSE